MSSNDDYHGMSASARQKAAGTTCRAVLRQRMALCRRFPHATTATASRPQPRLMHLQQPQSARRTGALEHVLDAAEEHHARLLARILHVDAGRLHVHGGRQVGLLAQPVALADAPLELQAVLRKPLQWGSTPHTQISAQPGALTSYFLRVTPSSWRCAQHVPCHCRAVHALQNDGSCHHGTPRLQQNAPARAR